MNKALEDIKVLDFSQLLAGPYAAMLLGDMGADVIKIERIETGDIYRRMTFMDQFMGGQSLPFLAWNRNKRSLSLDLKDGQVIEMLYTLAEQSDIVIHNFRPGVMEKLGLGYEKLSEINRGLIYGENSGFGATGPYSDRPGQDLLAQGLSGIMSLTGKKNAPPTSIGTGLADHLSAYQLVYGLLSALHYRDKTGQGQKVEVNLLASMLAFENQEFTTILNSRVPVERPESGIALPMLDAPYGVYACSNGYITIAMNDFEKLVKALGDISLLAYSDCLYEKRDEVFFKIESITMRQSKEFWLEKFLSFDLWVSEVLHINEVKDNPQVRHLDLFKTIDHEKAGEIHTVGPGVKMSRTNPEIKSAPPEVGKHSKVILREFGVEDSDIESLVKRGVLFDCGD